MANRKSLLWAISFHHLCNDGTLMALIALLPILVDEMDISLYEVGVLGLGLIVTVVVQYAVGKVVDRKLSTVLLEAGAALMASSFLLLLLVNDFTSLFAAVIVMRVGSAFYHPVGTSWISRAFSGPQLDTALGVQSGVGNLGVIIAWITSGFLGESYGWKTPCILWAALNLSAVVVGVLVIKETGVAPAPMGREGRINSKQTFKKIGILAIPMMTGGALYQVTSYYGPLNLTETESWSAANADLMFAFWIAVGTVTSYYFGTICARFGRGWLMKVAYAVSGVSVLCLALTDTWYFVGLTLFAYGALLYVTYPALFSLVTEATEENERGTAFGILFGLQLGGGATTVYACGALSDALGDPAYSFLVVFVMAIVSIVALSVRERASGQGKC